MNIEKKKKKNAIHDDYFPYVIREILFAPPCSNEDISKLLEVALNYHNTSFYQLAIETYIRAQNMWIEIVFNKRKKELIELKLEEILKQYDVTNLTMEGHGQTMEKQKEEVEENVINELRENTQQYDYLTPQQMIFFRCAIGSVYESAGNDELALSEYLEAKKFADIIDHPDSAFPYSCVGGVYFHLGQFQLSLKYYTKTLEIRKTHLDDYHVDIAIALNNIAVCQQCLSNISEAHLLYKQSYEILKERLGQNHPRTCTVVRNMARAKSNYLKNYSFDDLPVKFNKVEIPIPPPESKSQQPEKNKKKIKKTSK
ncbi:hypothetical protein ABK040_011104 [Willaertia magna]